MALTNHYNTRIVKGTEAEFTDDDTVWEDNVFIYTTDTHILKIGDGLSAWSALSVVNPGHQNV